MISRIKSWLIGIGLMISLLVYTYFRGSSSAKQSNRVETIERGIHEIAKSKGVSESVNSLADDKLRGAAAKWVRK